MLPIDKQVCLKKLVGKRVLLKDRSSFSEGLYEVKILELTKKNIKIEYLSGAIDWIAIKEFMKENEIEEVLKVEVKG